MLKDLDAWELDIYLLGTPQPLYKTGFGYKVNPIVLYDDLYSNKNV